MLSENSDLNMGIIFANLIASGNIPVVKYKFISLHTGKVRHGADIFSSLLRILEGPEDLESSTFNINLIFTQRTFSITFWLLLTFLHMGRGVQHL